MDITVTNNEQTGRYEGRTADGMVVGFAAYRRRGDHVDLPHTVTVPRFGGQGVASTVVRAALDDIRSQGRKVIPTCSFVADFIRQNDEYADLVAER